MYINGAGAWRGFEIAIELLRDLLAGEDKSLPALSLLTGDCFVDGLLILLGLAKNCFCRCLDGIGEQLGGDPYPKCELNISGDITLPELLVVMRL